MLSEEYFTIRFKLLFIVEKLLTDNEHVMDQLIYLTYLTVCLNSVWVCVGV